jgi:hypothetical protein
METNPNLFFMILWMSTYVTFSRGESFWVLRLNESLGFESLKNSFCDVQESFAIMIKSRIKIGTVAPFASIKDALNIFGEGFSTKVQHNFTISLSPN